jgi:hypothetical protein
MKLQEAHRRRQERKRRAMKKKELPISLARIYVEIWPHLDPGGELLVQFFLVPGAQLGQEGGGRLTLSLHNPQPLGSHHLLLADDKFIFYYLYGLQLFRGNLFSISANYYYFLTEPSHRIRFTSKWCRCMGLTGDITLKKN